MATINVSNQTQFLAALKVVKGGDTILLADGHYGEVTLKNDYGTPVIIKSASPLGATFGKVTLDGATNMTFDGLQLEKSFRAENFSSKIAVQNCDIDSMMYFRNVNGLTVDNCDVSGGQYGILLNTVQNFKVTNNSITKATEDLMRVTGNSFNGLIENNVIADLIVKKGIHPDIIQLFAAEGKTPHDITIRGNLLYDDPTTGDPGTAAQGIFLSDPSTGGFKNILIEQNLINTRASNTIYINGGQQNVVVRDNTLLPGNGDGGAIIRIAEKSGMSNAGTIIENNIAKLILDETKRSTIGDNFLYGRDADIDSMFLGLTGADWRNFLPVDGSAVDFGSGYGAAARLLELVKAAGGWAALDLENLAPPPPPPPIDQGPAGVAFAHDKTHEVSGSKTWVALKHNDTMELDQGAIGLTFNADTVSGKMGIISKGAAGNRDDFSAYIVDGKLFVSFENGQSSVTITKAGLKAHTDYDLLITFDDHKVKVWLDDQLVGEQRFDIDLSDNSEFLVLGAMNGQSTRGTTNKVGSFFDGTLSDLTFYNQALTPAEQAALDDGGHAAALEDISASSSIFSDM